jgi:hypothetical protein
MRWISVAIALLAAWAVIAVASESQDVQRGQQAWADVRVLADDRMEGRRAGTPGHRRAAEYVAEQFRGANLQPAGEGGFLQPVTLEVRQINESASSLALVRAGRSEQVSLGPDAIFILRGGFSPSIDAPLVFAGYGLKLPQFGVDDLAGLDLKGKVVVAFVAAPKSVPGTAGAHFGASAERWKLYHAAGAVGVIFIPNPFSMDLPWERVALTRTEPFMALTGPEEDQFPDQKLWVQFNPARLGMLLTGTPHTAESMLAKLKAGEMLPRFELPARVRATIDAPRSRVTSENVAGILPGSDPALRSELVVLSAHLDHLGIGSKGEGDRIFNGAMDNASGIAVLIDIARQLDRNKRRGRRSIVFAAVTAEESGLLGSRAFVSRTQSQERPIIANLNTDMFLPLFPMKQLIVFGVDESELGKDARSVGQALGVTIENDPQPLRNRFIRSDQYSFIRAGIPSLAMKIGFQAGSPQAEVERAWFAERYHAPADDLAQPVDFSAVGRYATFMENLALRVADRSQRPEWNRSSTFATVDAGTPVSHVLFVCEHGNVKSLMAASYFNQMAQERGLSYRALSRGTDIDSTTVPPPIIAALKSDGFDVSAFHPVVVSADDVSASLRVVTIGTALPKEAGNPGSLVEHWTDVPAASVDYAAARVSLKRHIGALLDQLAP